jgi:hypothetical protein
MDELSIWWLHERNSRVYFTCIDIETCPNSVSFGEDDDSANKQCCCHRSQIVVPQEIGEWWQPLKLNTRSYIPISAECPICLLPMIHKRNAWITYCGHAFHRTCLVQSYYSYMNNKDIVKYTNCIPCPICRSDLPNMLYWYRCIKDIKPSKNEMN